MPTQRDEEKRVTIAFYQAYTFPQQFFNQTAAFEHCEDKSELRSRNDGCCISEPNPCVCSRVEQKPLSSYRYGSNQPQCFVI